MYEDLFNRFQYGNIKVVDLHNLTKEEARAEVLYQIESVDTNFDGIEFVHGYHGGHVLKNFIRKEFSHNSIDKKINVSASSTLILLKKPFIL